MALKEIVTRFGFEIDDHGLKELEEGISSIKEGLLHLGELLIGEAVGLYELVEKTSEAGVKLKIMTQETGLAAEKLQELQFRAKLADISVDQLNQSMNFLARNLEQARQGSEEARKHFRMLGVSTAEIKAGTATADVVLQRMAKTFEHLPDGPRKTGLAMEIFGRSGARMVPFLNKLNEALTPVNRQILEMSIVTEAQIEQSEEFHVSLETLKTGLLGITRVVGFGLMPVATEIVESMKKWVIQNKDLITANLTEFVKGMAAALKVTIKIVDALVESFSGLAHSIGGVRVTTELLLGTMAILSGLTVLFGIGKLTQAVYSLATAFGVANAAAAIVPTLIGAALVSIFLIMEDIYSFFNGKNSFLGDLLSVLPEIGNLFKSVFEPIFEPFVALITMITDGTATWGKAFEALGTIIVNAVLSPLRAVFSIIAGISSVFGRLTGLNGFRAAAEGIQAFSEDITVKGLSDSLGSLGPQAAVAGAGGGSGRQTNNSVQLSQQYNFPPGTDPATVVDKIANSTSSGLDDVLRSTNRSTSSGGDY